MPEIQKMKCQLWQTAGQTHREHEAMETCQCGSYRPIEHQGEEWLVCIECINMIDPATGWFEIVEIPEKVAIKHSTTLGCLAIRGVNTCRV